MHRRAGLLALITLTAACAASSSQPPASSSASDAAAHQAHEAYVAAINSNNLHRDADGKWRVARDAWGPDHPAK